MNNKNTTLIFRLVLFAILILASVLRFYRLGEVPHGMSVDEAAIGYNGYAIITTRRDEWLEKLPISFRSFGDYKAPLAIYLNGPFTYLFGMTLFAVRLPFAIAGVLAVLAFYFLVREIFYTSRKREILALVGAGILAISPWHIHFSRLGFEAGIALTTSIWAIYFLLAYLRQPRWLPLFCSVFASAATFYSYHSSKLSFPLLLLFVLFQHMALLKKHWRQFLVGGIVGIICLIPLFYDALYKNGLTRMGSTLFSQHLPLMELLSRLGQNALSYVSPSFLVFGAAEGNLRHSDGMFGVLDYASFVLLVLLLLAFCRQRLEHKKIPHPKLFAFSALWALSGLLPAIIGDSPAHTVRSLGALPGFLLLELLAIESIIVNKKVNQRLFMLLFVLIEVLNLAAYQYHYYTVYAKQSAEAFQDGYLETFQYLRDFYHQDVQKIIFTTEYDHPYIYALFVNRVNPIAWQGGILHLFEFHDHIYPSDISQPQTIVVVGQRENFFDRPADKIIRGSDQQAKFFVYLPQAK